MRTPQLLCDYMLELFNNDVSNPLGYFELNDQRQIVDRVGATGKVCPQTLKLPWPIWLDLTRRMVTVTDGKIQRYADDMSVTLAFAKKEDILSRLQERGYINLSSSPEPEAHVAAASEEATDEGPDCATRERRGGA